jgi:adaptin ear-binding coat-associated protein 1/2
MRLVTRDDKLLLKLEDRNSGELFAVCPVEAHPGAAIEPVLDSSRYFVVRLQDDAGRNAFVGLGFNDRSDAFDLNVALQDHFKQLRQEEDAERALKELAEGPKLDLSFKEGQTIRINLNTKKGDTAKKHANATGNVSSSQSTSAETSSSDYASGSSTNPFL